MCKSEDEKKNQVGDSSNISKGDPDLRNAVIPIERYTKDFYDIIKKKYQEMDSYFNENKAAIEKKQNYFKKESQLMTTRFHKFLSHMLMESQREMHKSMDNHRKVFKDKLDTFDDLLQS